MKHLLPLLFLTILLGVLGFSIIRPLWSRQHVLKILRRDEITGPKFVEICSILASINISCPEHTFLVERAGNMLFRGRPITVVWGSIGSQGVSGRTGGWRIESALFALADAEQVDWMKANSDVFSPVFLGSPFSLFAVKRSAVTA